MRTLATLILAMSAGISAWSPPADASASRPHVCLQIRVASQRLRAAMSQEGVFLDRASESVAKVLEHKMPFATFRRSVTSKDTLILRLTEGDPTNSGGACNELGLQIELRSSGRISGQSYCKLRDRELCNRALGPPEIFAAEVGVALDRMDDALLVNEVLSHLSIADTALCVPELPCWILPFRGEQVCLDLRSVVKVAGDVPDSIVGVLPGEFDAEVSGSYNPPNPISVEAFRGCLMLIAKEPESGSMRRFFENLRGNPRRLVIHAMFVKNFIRRSTCLELPPPGDDFVPAHGEAP